MSGLNREVKIFLFCLIAGSFSFLFILVQRHFSSQAMLAQVDQSASQKQTREEEQVLIQPVVKPLKKESAFVLETGAQSALSLLIYPEEQSGLQPKILFKKEINKKLPIASVSKLMTAVVVLENYSLQTEIKISKEAISQEGEAGRLNPNEILSTENLLYIMLIESSNDAAEAFAENTGKEKFIELMNQKAKSLEMENTFFVNSNGLDEGNQNTNTSSALDLAKLVIYIQKNHPLIGEILSRKEFSFSSPDGRFRHNLVSTNSLLYDSQTLWGKTGYTKKANGCMINLIRPQSNDNLIIINVVLGADDRFYEIQRLTDWLNNSFIW